MKNICVKTEVDCSFEKVVEKFNENLFRHLVKGFPPVFIEKFDGLSENDETHLRLLLPIGPLWISVMSNFEKSDSVFQFIDQGSKLPFPLSYWLHTHRVEKINDHKTAIIDKIQFRSIFGTENLMQLVIGQDMKNRGPKYKSYFEQSFN